MHLFLSLFSYFMSTTKLPLTAVTRSSSLLPEQVAQALSISDDTVRRLVAKGWLRGSKNSRNLLITRASLSRILSDGSGCGIDLTQELQIHGSCLVMTPSEAAAVLQVHRKTILRKVANGELLSCPHLGVVRITKAAFERWIKSKKIEVGAPRSMPLATHPL